MTGRDLIIYILKNDLEDKPIFEDGKFIGFMNVNEAALKFNVGTSTIEIWCILDYIPSVTIGENFYIPVDAVKREDLKVSKGE